MDFLDGLKTEKGYLREEYNSGDEVHLNGKYLHHIENFLSQNWNF